MKRIFTLFFLSMVATVTAVAQQAPTPKWSDIDYVGDGHVGHLLDIYLPEQTNDPCKVIVLIYGSAWHSNDQKKLPPYVFAKPLMDVGFAVVSINHRSSLEAHFPSQMHDVKAAIRYIRANADKYQLDTSFIGVTGYSSGGHLAGFLGLTNGVKRAQLDGVTFEIEGSLGAYQNYRSDVDAVVDWYGPMDLYRMDQFELLDNIRQALDDFVVGRTAERKTISDLCSPTFYIDRCDAPFLVIHGDDDPLVPYDQSVYFSEKLREVGILDQFITVPGGDHGFKTIKDDTITAMVEFFCRYAEKK